MGQSARSRPAGRLVWFHAASVGEAQSTLILVNALLARFPTLNVLITTGTVTSAELMAQRLPDRAFHQYYPLDHPDWVESFLNHWKPDLIFWMESELWPNMLRAIRMRNIHCVLVNARMSRRSYRRWKHLRGTAAALLSAFDLCLAQTPEDAESFTKLCMLDVRVRDNLKYAADPLPCDSIQLSGLKDAIGDRPVWLFASTHAGEEELACEIHLALRHKVLNLLTIIVPRHPERGGDIVEMCNDAGLRTNQRGQKNSLPWGGDEIYVADTLGELGLFYRLAPIACIGRTFSLDGGGGHNPIEPAQLGCAVLHGPLIQNQSRLFAEMHECGAAVGATTSKELEAQLLDLLTHPAALAALRAKDKAFADSKAALLPLVMEDIEPFLADSGILAECKQCA